MGSHSVRLVGWGEENGKIYSAVLLYKLAENITFKVCSIGVLRIPGAMIGERYKSKSFSLLQEHLVQNGFFRIVRGRNACKIESLSIDFGSPDVRQAEARLVELYQSFRSNEVEVQDASDEESRGADHPMERDHSMMPVRDPTGQSKSAHRNGATSNSRSNGKSRGSSTRIFLADTDEDEEAYFRDDDESEQEDLDLEHQSMKRRNQQQSSRNHSRHYK